MADEELPISDRLGDEETMSYFSLARIKREVSGKNSRLTLNNVG